MTLIISSFCVPQHLPMRCVCMSACGQACSFAQASEMCWLGMQVKIWAHIADPSRWVGPDSPLAAEAKDRTSTMYLATGKTIF